MALPSLYKLLNGFLIVVTLFITQPNSLLAIEENADDAETDLDGDADNLARPIEIGPAGNLKPENPYRTTAEEASPFHFHSIWESRYVTEGRDNLAGDSLLSVSTDINYGKFTFAPWLANSSASDYRELNLNLVYGFEIGNSIEVYTSYTYLRFDVGDIYADDTEIGVEFVYNGGLRYLSFKTSWLHSFEVDGSYFEFATQYNNVIGNLGIAAALSTGVNDGYIFDGHDGLDHLRIRLNLVWHQNAHLGLTAYYSYTQSINRDAIIYPGDVSLGNFAWFGLGLTYRF